jgi:hypothetical protein
MSKTLKLSLNIGKKDAPRLGLTDKTLAGDVVTVKDEAADEMLAKGWAVEPGREAPAEAAPRGATPPAGTPPPTGHAPAEDFFDGMTKEDLKAYADDFGIAGVTMAQTKDEMVKAIKKAAK